MLLTSKLRQKLDALGSGYELTHAPMDADLVPSSVYYQILKDQHMNLNFLMPQFYNGITKAVADGVTRGKQGRDSAISLGGSFTKKSTRPPHDLFWSCGAGGSLFLHRHLYKVHLQSGPSGRLAVMT